MKGELQAKLQRARLLLENHGYLVYDPEKAKKILDWIEKAKARVRGTGDMSPKE